MRNLTRKIKENRLKINYLKSELEEALKNKDIKRFVEKFPRNLSDKQRITIAYDDTTTVFLYKEGYQIIPDENIEELEDFLDRAYYNKLYTPKSFDDLLNERISYGEFVEQLPEGVEYFILTSKGGIKFWKKNGKIYYVKTTKNRGKRYDWKKIKKFKEKWINARNL